MRSSHRYLALALLAGCASTPSTTTTTTTPPTDAIPAYVRSAVDAADRDAADRELDAGRRPAELLTVLGVAPGMRIGEVAAGGGYTTELLMRVVGETGQVHGHNNPFMLARFAEAPWTARLAKPVNARIVRHDREFEDPFGPDVRDLDLVVNVLVYHDTVWQGTDRHAMNRAIYAALRPGGRYIIVDHSARAGDGATVTETLHRIEESVLREEIPQAGFRLVGTSDLLRAADDTREWSASPRTAGERRGTSDRFILIFEK